MFFVRLGAVVGAVLVSIVLFLVAFGLNRTGYVSVSFLTFVPICLIISLVASQLYPVRFLSKAVIGLSVLFNSESNHIDDADLKTKGDYLGAVAVIAYIISWFVLFVVAFFVDRGVTFFLLLTTSTAILLAPLLSDGKGKIYVQGP